MESSTTPKQRWILTGEALAKFLACLDADAARAGARYEQLRLALVKFFDWRRAQFPEELADEVINRVIRKVDEGETLRDVPSYCLGVARLVWRESLKRPESQRADLEELGPLAAPAADFETDERQACFEHCLQALSPENRQIILQYYRDEGREKINHRLALSERLGIPLNALRSRVQRIRARLEQCTLRCLQKSGTRPT